MDLSLGPLLFHWGKDLFYKFYEEMADTPISTVYLGEVVCSDRKGVELEDIAAVASMLTARGKKVYLSTLGLIATDRELGMTRDLCALPYAVEANNMAVFNMVSTEGGKALSAGPHLTIYNTPSLKFIERLGTERITFLVELPRTTIGTLARAASIKTEVFAFGRLPLAFSWRCYTSRNFGKLRSQCTQDCMKFPDGIALNTLDNKPVFAINGTQVMSNQLYCLAEEVDELKSLGVSTLRLSPHSWDMKEIISIYKAVIDGGVTGKNAKKDMERLTGTELCNGWYYGKAGWEHLSGDARPAVTGEKGLHVRMA